MPGELTNQELLQLNAQGLIPGPNEDETSFRARVDYCLKMHNSFFEDFGFTKEQIPPLEDAFKDSKKWYGIAPTWVPLVFSNYKLAPWHGGSAWIFQMTRQSPTAAFLQLRRAFLHKNRYLGIYERDEIITHETAHIGRMVFEEPKFEEFLAYQSAPWFRRIFGPIIQAPWEGILFITSVFLYMLLEVFLPFSDLLPVIKWLPIILLLLGGLRLASKHYHFSKTLKNLQQALPDPTQARYVIYRLTDEEIIRFSSRSPKEISEFIEKESQTSLRWRLIKLAYTSSNNGA